MSKPEGLGPERIRAAIDESLERLSTSYVEVYYLHVPDAQTPIDETLGAMKDVLATGKAKAWGVSNFASWQILEMMHIADKTGMPRPVVSQQMYNLLIRQLDIEYFKFTARHPIHTTITTRSREVFSPVNTKARRPCPAPASTTTRFTGTAIGPTRSERVSPTSAPSRRRRECP